MLTPLHSPAADRAVAGIIAICSLLAAGCDRMESLYRETQPLMGTFVEITVSHTQEQPALEALKAAFGEMQRIEELMSPYLQGSEISRINKGAYPNSLQIDREVFALIEKSVEYSRITHGAFDITVGPLMQLWPFYREDKTLPTEQQVAATLKRVGSDKLLLNDQHTTIQFKVRGMALDLGGVAKGYAVDRAVALLKSKGISRALVNAGGDLYALGTRPDGTRWRLGVRHPRRHDDLIAAFGIENSAVVTSGDYERYFIKDGTRYCHIIDPRTGYPVRGVVSVTVEATNATHADALATGIFVLGREQGMRFMESLPDVEGAIIAEKAPGILELQVSGGFRMLFRVQSNLLRY